MKTFPLLAAAVLATIFLSSCTVRDREHQIYVSIPDQRMVVLKNGTAIAAYPVSTSKFAIGDARGSRGTPLGQLEVAQKVGAGAPSGAVFKSRRRTGEVLPPDAPGRDPIVSRIFWLRGLEPQNQNAYSRYIYIHGTTEEAKIGSPASYGCVRMRSSDVIALYNVVGVGAQVNIANAPLHEILPPPVDIGG